MQYYTILCNSSLSVKVGQLLCHLSDASDVTILMYSRWPSVLVTSQLNYCFTQDGSQRKLLFLETSSIHSSTVVTDHSGRLHLWMPTLLCSTTGVDVIIVDQSQHSSALDGLDGQPASQGWICVTYIYLFILDHKCISFICFIYLCHRN